MSTSEIIQLIQVASTVLGPLVTFLIKQYAPDLPRLAMPIISAVVSGTAAAGVGADLTGIAAASTGGVFLREVVDQTKKANRRRKARQIAQLH